MLSDVFLIAAIVMFLFIGWRDFQTLRIRNVHVGILIGIFALYTLSRGFDGIVDAAIAGGILFGISFIFWLFRAIGAGDVKLYLPLGLFIGYNGLLPYAVFLTIFSLVLLLIIKIGGRFSQGQSNFGQRLIDLRASGKVPYGVPMGLSAICVLVGERMLGI